MKKEEQKDENKKVKNKVESKDQIGFDENFVDFDKWPSVSTSESSDPEPKNFTDTHSLSNKEDALRPTSICSEDLKDLRDGTSSVSSIDAAEGLDIPEQANKSNRFASYYHKHHVKSV